MIGFGNKLQTTRMDPSLAIQLWQLLPGNTTEFVVSVENMGIAAGIFHRTSQTGSNFK